MKRCLILSLAMCCIAAFVARPARGDDKIKDAAGAAADEAKKKMGEAGQQMADEAKKKLQDATALTGKDGAAPGGMSKEDMEKMMKLGMPGPEHEYLKALEGKWDAVVKMRMGPDAPWDESKGVMTNKMIMGGRWLQMDFNGMSMGQPFNGTGYMGYDNVMKKYVATWMDSQMTGMMVTYGAADSAHRSFTMEGEMPDPMAGGKMSKYRTVTTIEGADKSSYKMYCNTPDGKEYCCLEIAYTKS